MASRQQTVAHEATINLNCVATFVGVVDAGSFTGAARALGVPKSSVSRAVARLERELGVVLLQRSTRRLSLTDAGHQYIKTAREAIHALAEARRSIVDADHEPRGTVRITAPIDPVGDMLAAPLARFALLYPQVYVDVLMTARRIDLIEEGVDLALRAGRLDDSSLVAKRLGPSPMHLVAAPAYLERRGHPKRMTDLPKHDCVLFKAVRGVQRWTLHNKDKSETVEVRGPINVDELTFVLPLAIAGVGIALVPSMLSRAAIASGQLISVLPRYELNIGSLSIVHTQGRHLPRRVELLRDFLYDALKTQMTHQPKAPA